MKEFDYYRNRLREVMYENDRNIFYLETKVDLSHTAILRFISNIGNPRPKTVKRIVDFIERLDNEK